MFLGCVGTDGPERAALTLQNPRRARVPIICLFGWGGKAKIHLHTVAVHQLGTKIQPEHRMISCLPFAPASMLGVTESLAQGVHKPVEKTDGRTS